MLFYSLDKIFFNKYFLLIIFFLIFTLPINNVINFVILIFFLLFLLIIEKFKKEIKPQYLIIISLLILFSYFFEKKSIIENHGIFLPNEINNEKYISNNSDIFNLLINEFKNSYSQDDIECTDQNYNCWKNVRIDNVFAKSYDYIYFGKFKYSRKINNINHNNISTARIGDINTIKFNWFSNPDLWWNTNIPNKIKRINAPYIIEYNFIDDKFNDSQICWIGKALINNKTSINNHKKLSCINISKNLNILFYNFNSDLEVKIKKSLKLLIFEIFLKFIQIITLILLLYFLVERINLTNLINYLLILFPSGIVLFYTIYNKKEFFFGYNPLQGGMDGIAHEGFGRNIVNHLYNFDFYQALKGSEDIFYFMPGLRYFSALEKILFGDNFFGLYIILIFFPLVFFIFLLKLNFNKKFSLLLILFFIFLKIPHLGFSYHHYIKNLLTVYPGTLAILFFLLSIIANFKKQNFLSALFSFFMVFLRPNYLPVFICLLIFNILSSIKDDEYKNIYKYIMGSSFIFLLPIHNFIYGEGSLVFLTNSSNINIFEHYDHRVHPLEYLYVIRDFKNFEYIREHLLHFITTGQNNYLVFFINLTLLVNIFIFLIFFFKKTNRICLLFCFVSISQQFPSFFYPNQGRYALFAWLLIFITNLLISKEYLKIFKSNKLVKY